MTRMPPATATPLHLTLDPFWDVLECFAVGAVLDAQPAGACWAAGENGGARWVASPDGRELLGFLVAEPWDVDVDALPELFGGPRFRVPLLGLDAASAGEVVLAVRGRFEPGEPTNDALCFHEGIGLTADDPEGALTRFRLALEAGHEKSRFAIGYVLVELGRHREAYDHLRRYAEVAAWNAWAWSWLGQACAGLGDHAEARAAYRRALELEAAGGLETDAGRRLAELGE
ncbi:MAG TPA: tetratricopeptide repeat protein [Baekduia sp.]|nr:tetratricopeptide repeat protein [Baekduia sp.]